MKTKVAILAATTVAAIMLASTMAYARCVPKNIPVVCKKPGYQYNYDRCRCEPEPVKLKHLQGKRVIHRVQKVDLKKVKICRKGEVWVEKYKRCLKVVR